jgi:hypothetical protein
VTNRERVRLAVVVAVTLAVVALRVSGETGGMFQAFAHLWVGGLLGAWIACETPRYNLVLVALLGLTELAMFFIIDRI